MNTYEETTDQVPEDPGTPAQEILPDRDILMMEKPVPDNRASRFRPADKKLLRNIVIIVLFLIALLVILWFIVPKGSNSGGVDAPKDVDITAPQ